MRSRYTAYALGGHGDYLLATWHPDTSGSLTAEILSQSELEWQCLQILDYSQHGNTGTVEFKADYIDAHGAPGTHHEKSRFKRLQGKWFYMDADS